MKTTIKTKVTVLKSGEVIVTGLPVKEGQRVDVTIKIENPVLPTHPLRGRPVKYLHPYSPALDEKDWDALK